MPFARVRCTEVQGEAAGDEVKEVGWVGRLRDVEQGVREIDARETEDRHDKQYGTEEDVDTLRKSCGS